MPPNVFPGIGPFVVSSFSGGGNCLEVARYSDGAVVRDTKDQQRIPLVFGQGGWDCFLRTVKIDGSHR